MTINYLNNLIKICLDIAEYVDGKGDQDKNWYGGELHEGLGLGYRALSAYLRKGVEEIINLQRAYHSALERKNYAEISEKSKTDFLVDIFGDPEPETINDKDKERIKEFVKSIMDEWDAEAEDE